MSHIRLMTNKTLKAFYDYLSTHRMVPTWELVTELKIVNPGGIASEVNAHIKNRGEKIVCHKVYFKEKKYHFYRLENIL